MCRRRPSLLYFQLRLCTLMQVVACFLPSTSHMALVWPSAPALALLWLPSPFMHACVLSHFSHVWLSATLWTVACQAPLCMGFSRQEYWSGLPCPPPGDLPDARIKPTSPALAGGFFTTSAPWEAHLLIHVSINPSSQSSIPHHVAFEPRAESETSCILQKCLGNRS